MPLLLPSQKKKRRADSLEAPNNHAATTSLNKTLIGPGCEYRWTGTGPEHDARGNLITREVED